MGHLRPRGLKHSESRSMIEGEQLAPAEFRPDRPLSATFGVTQNSLLAQGALQDRRGPVQCASCFDGAFGITRLAGTVHHRNNDMQKLQGFARARRLLEQAAAEDRSTSCSQLSEASQILSTSKFRLC